MPAVLVSSGTSGSSGSHPTCAQDGLLKNRANDDQPGQVLQKQLLHRAHELCQPFRLSSSSLGRVPSCFPSPRASVTAGTVHPGWGSSLAESPRATGWQGTGSSDSVWN